MVQALQDLDLANGSDRETLLLVVHAHFLQGHNLSSAFFFRHKDLAVCAFSNLLNVLEFLRNPCAMQASYAISKPHSFHR